MSTDGWTGGRSGKTYVAFLVERAPTRPRNSWTLCGVWSDGTLDVIADNITEERARQIAFAVTGDHYWLETVTQREMTAAIMRPDKEREMLAQLKAKYEGRS